MMTRKIKLWDINVHITCHLCNGYLIDATTVTECLHTFCRSCLVKYLEENNTCPTCRIVIHQSHPLQYIGHDRTMQDIVYKLVPGLQEEEMKKQREFYHKLGMEVPGDIKGETCSAKQHLDSHSNGETKPDENLNKETSEEKQEEDNDYHRSDEQVSICLECNSSKLRGLKRKWIRCSAQATVLHLKKFIAKKLNLSSFNEVSPLVEEIGDYKDVKKLFRTQNDVLVLYSRSATAESSLRLLSGVTQEVKAQDTIISSEPPSEQNNPRCQEHEKKSDQPPEAEKPKIKVKQEYAYEFRDKLSGLYEKFICEKLDILCNEEILGKDHTLKFVVVTRWRFKKAPLLLHYRPKMDLL